MYPDAASAEEFFEEWYRTLTQLALQLVAAELLGDRFATREWFGQRLGQFTRSDRLASRERVVIADRFGPFFEQKLVLAPGTARRLSEQTAISQLELMSTLRTGNRHNLHGRPTTLVLRGSKPLGHVHLTKSWSPLQILSPIRHASMTQATGGSQRSR
jgi:hypothetical protein